MRFTLVRVAENAESIAFYGGAKREQSTVRKSIYKMMQLVTAHYWQM